MYARALARQQMALSSEGDCVPSRTAAVMAASQLRVAFPPEPTLFMLPYGPIAQSSADESSARG